MKTSIALASVTVLAGSLTAYAQTEQPTQYHHYHIHRYQGPHHTVHHHFVAHNPAPAPIAQRPGETVENAPPSAINQMFRPYAQPGEGDDDGLSRDPDDCMKGCIGGNPQ